MFVLFYQASLDQGTIPDDWKTANVVTIFKEGDRNRPENYRSVPLTSSACKTLEHIVCSSIHRHLEAHGILTDPQHGFRKRRSCETRLILAVQDLAKTVDGRGQTDVILLEFSKAFGKVPHQRPLHNLEFDGVRSSRHRWISSFLRYRLHQVLPSASVHSGVPQGSVFGLLLFLPFINDMPEYISPDSTARLFADDCILYRNIEIESDARDLQHDLDRLQQWEKDWLMEFDPLKYQVLHITTKRKPIQTSYTIHGQTLQEVDSAKYLGVTFQNNLSWNQNIDSAAKNTNNTRAFLQMNLQQRPRTTKDLCYRTLIRSILYYASVVWDPVTEENIRKLEMVQQGLFRLQTHKQRIAHATTPPVAHSPGAQSTSQDKHDVPHSL